MSILHYDQNQYVVDCPEYIHIKQGTNVLNLMVPKGFIFDVSIPWYLQWILSPHDNRFLKAAAFHDYALHKLRWDREVAAAVFGVALRDSGVGKYKRLFMVLGVTMWNWR